VSFRDGHGPGLGRPHHHPGPTIRGRPAPAARFTPVGVLRGARLRSTWYRPRHEPVGCGSTRPPTRRPAPAPCTGRSPPGPGINGRDAQRPTVISAAWYCARPGKTRRGLPPDPGGTGRAGHLRRALDRMGDAEESRDRPGTSPDRADLEPVPAAPRRKPAWPRTSSLSVCPTARLPTSGPLSSTPPGVSASSAAQPIPPAGG
jgi:hypothetical protein